MSQAENLLNSLSANTTHTHQVIDSDTYFIIDPISREITNTARRKNVLMQFDHDSERYTFELPRYVEGHDMSLCTHVKVHYNNIDGTTGQTNADVDDLYDLQVDPQNEENVICSWLISRQATQLAGNLSFLVQYICKLDDGTISYEWHSDIYSDIEVKKGLNNGKAVTIAYSDILEQWRDGLFKTTMSTFQLTLYADKWVESPDKTYYMQAVDYAVGANSKVDMQPTATQVIELINNGISMFVSNDSGVLTAYAIGGTPSDDMTIQAIETVVSNV